MKIAKKLGIALIVLASHATLATTNETAEAQRLAQLHTQLAELKQRWHNDRDTMLRRIAALKERHHAITNTTADLRVTIEKLDTEKKRLTDTRDRLQSHYDTLVNTVIDEHERLQNTLTAPLTASSRLGTLDQSVLKTQSDKTLTPLLTDYAELATDTCRFAMGFHLGTTIIDRSDQDKLHMDTLQIGTVLAFAVSPDASQAAIAMRYHDDWAWLWRPEAAPHIRHAIDIVRNERAPTLVHLPVPPREKITRRTEDNDQ